MEPNGSPLDPPPWWQQLQKQPWLALVPLAYVVFLFGRLHYGASGLVERDGYFHARFANLLPSFGLSREFHWTQTSTWNGQFCDKEFLFHLLMAPFATNAADPLAGVRLYALILSCAIFVALYFVLKANGSRWPVLFALLPLCAGGQFIVRASMIRSHVLSIVLLIISMHFLLRKNWKATAAIGFVYAWSYTFPLLLVMTAVPLAVGRWIGRGGLDWKTPTAALAGVLLGLVIHPYSPYTLETFLTLLQIVTQASTSTGAELELGSEIYSGTLREFLINMPVFHLVWIVMLASVVMRRKLISADAMGAVLAALFWYAMTKMYSRFVEYSFPLQALAAGLVMRDLLAAQATAMVAWSREGLAAAAVAGVLMLAGGHAYAVTQVDQATAGIPPARFKRASDWMARNLNPGDTAVNLEWVEFPEWYYDGYRQNYLWGIDPTFTLRFDKETAHALEDMRLQRIHIHPQWMKDVLHARVLVMGHTNALRFVDLTSSNWTPVYVDEMAVIFALDGPHAPGPLSVREGEPPPLAFKARDLPLNAPPPAP